MLKCQVCQTSHPRGLPKVCLELDHFLEEQFPKEYMLRRDAILLKLVDVEHKHPTICMPEYLISLFNVQYKYELVLKNILGCLECAICF